MKRLNLAGVLTTLLAACWTVSAGDAIVVCGKKIPIGARVVLWSDPGGFNAYMPPASKKKAEQPDSDKKGYGSRKSGDEYTALVESVDQFVLHYDVCGISKTCFKVLNDRGLSVHFMLDLDGTIYQSLDLKERAYHATIANHRSIGVEIAHMGAYSVNGPGNRTAEWYKSNDNGEVFITIPPRFGDPGFKVPNFVPRPRKSEPVVGNIQGKDLKMYDYTPQQYESLIKLTAALCTVFPRIKCDYPRDGEGKLIPRKLDEAAFARYEGVLGHYHVQLNKTDPGPALDWDYLIENARKEMAKKKAKSN